MDFETQEEDGGVRITLSDRDWEAFAAALENPPEPNEELKKLMGQSSPRKKKAAKRGESNPALAASHNPHFPA